MATAPLLTREAYVLTQRGGQATQYGVLGRALAVQCVYFFIHVTDAFSLTTCISSKGASEVLHDQRLYLNTVGFFFEIPLLAESHRLPFR